MSILCNEVEISRGISKFTFDKSTTNDAFYKFKFHRVVFLIIITEII